MGEHDGLLRRGRRRRMTKFVITELSAVDRPAQEGARALIVKRGDAATSLDGELQRVRRLRGPERPTAARVLKARCDEALDALAAGEVAKSGDGEPEVWTRLFGREDVRELLDLQRFAEGLIPS